MKRALTHDELDAVALAWVGWMHRRGAAMLIGSPDEGVMVLPRPSGHTDTLGRVAPPLAWPVHLPGEPDLTGGVSSGGALLDPERTGTPGNRTPICPWKTP